MNKKTKETVYRSPDGQRWRITSTPKYGDQPHAVRIKDGFVSWTDIDRMKLVEESIWLKQQKKKSKSS